MSAELFSSLLSRAKCYSRPTMGISAPLFSLAWVVPAGTEGYEVLEDVMVVKNSKKRRVLHTRPWLSLGPFAYIPPRARTAVGDISVTCHDQLGRKKRPVTRGGAPCVWRSVGGPDGEWGDTSGGTPENDIAGSRGRQFTNTMSDVEWCWSLMDVPTVLGMIVSWIGNWPVGQVQRDVSRRNALGTAVQAPDLVVETSLVGGNDCEPHRRRMAFPTVLHSNCEHLSRREALSARTSRFRVVAYHHSHARVASGPMQFELI